MCVCAWSHIIYIINIYIYTARQHLSKRLHWSKASFTGPIFPKQPCFWKVRSCMVAATGGISKEFSSWWHLPIHIAPGSNFLTLKSWRLKSSQQPKKTDQSGCYNTGGGPGKQIWLVLPKFSGIIFWPGLEVTNQVATCFYQNAGDTPPKKKTLIPLLCPFSYMNLHRLVWFIFFRLLQNWIESCQFVPAPVAKRIGPQVWWWGWWCRASFIFVGIHNWNHRNSFAEYKSLQKWPGFFVSPPALDSWCTRSIEPRINP